MCLNCGSENEDVHVCMLSHVRLFATLWTVAFQTPLSMGFSRKNTGEGCHRDIQKTELKIS